MSLLKKICVIGLVFLFSCDNNNGPDSLTKTKELSALTWNVYIGTDVTRLAEATDQESLSQITQDLLAEIQRTNFHTRSFVIAEKIASLAPDVIGIQEATTFLNNENPVFNVDYLELLLTVLNTKVKPQGFEYVVAGRVNTIDLTIPITETQIQRIVDSDAILVKKSMEFENVIEKKYEADFELSVSGQSFKIRRGFVSIEINNGDGTHTTITNTHLETSVDLVRAGQAAELLDYVNNKSNPVIALGDFNSPAPDGLEYLSFLAGHKDVWNEDADTRNLDGFTSSQDSNLQNESSKLTDRIDFIFVSKPHFVSTETEIVGNKIADISSNLWPSDHAGVFAKIKLKY